MFPCREIDAARTVQEGAAGDQDQSVLVQGMRALRLLLQAGGHRHERRRALRRGGREVYAVPAM